MSLLFHYFNHLVNVFFTGLKIRCLYHNTDNRFCTRLTKKDTSIAS